ncbi:pectin lyase fold/virulence factor [Lentinula aciculospora]|uniref:galacturonan 1,4-alpha-galacturonidase n=1 Tax=Lentinula aciculospora TaxID=153920 RepID=A0A9W9DXY0_9AGAR|nr:pectin lyase fold/virulence factor [Lentinula aciculospora]
MKPKTFIPSLIIGFLSSVLIARGFGIQSNNECTVTPLGDGQDDTDQVLAAISQCGTNGTITFTEGSFDITRKMTWELNSARVHLFGYLNFVPDVEYWLNMPNTYQVVFIQSQSSWFVVTGSDFEIDAHNTGGIQGNGQIWWDFFSNRTREDGDGRPISLTLFNVTRGIVRNFRIDAQPFWCNCVVESEDVVYDGMLCNATNTNPEFAGTNLVPNTDGIDTYRSNNVTLMNWDITCGDDCLAIKGNTTNLLVRNVTCNGGNGIAFGSLGQYVNLSDIVENVYMEDLKMVRLPSNVQPNMGTGVYLKTWTGEVNGTPPTGGGGGTGHVRNVTIHNVKVDQVDIPVHVYQTNGGSVSETPSTLMFSGLHFEDWTGNATGNTIVEFVCSPAVNCTDLTVESFHVTPAANEAPRYICQNVTSISGLQELCSLQHRVMQLDRRDGVDELEV